MLEQSDRWRAAGSCSGHGAGATGRPSRSEPMWSIFGHRPQDGSATIQALILFGEAVTIQMVAQHMNEGRFTPKDVHVTSATTMLNELVRWAEALKPLRQPAA